MKRGSYKISVIVFVAVLFYGISAFAGEVNRHAIDDVAAGKITTANVSWWGFDEKDSTKALQSAINSGAKKLIVENMGKPWIVESITLAGDQEIVFEKGVEVRAKRGSFKGTGDSLFTGSGIQNVTLRGYGATLRMWRKDYADPTKYERAEWRMILRFSKCQNVKIYGLTLAESGGDGIYLGGPFNRNVHIKDVTCIRNLRQGISVIACEDLLIENCLLAETSGVPPQSGIDFEPNYNYQRISAVIRNCVTKDNKSTGYTIAINKVLPLLSLRFENCKSIRDGHAGTILDLCGHPDARGTIEFVNCSFEGNKGSGIIFMGNASNGRKVTFKDCSILDPVSENTGMTPILMESSPGAMVPMGNVDFGKMRIRGSEDRRPIRFGDKAAVGLENVTGTLIVEKGKVTGTFVIDQKLIDKWMPAAVMKELPRLKPGDLSSYRPVAARTVAPPEALSDAFLRGAYEMLLYAKEGDSVEFKINYKQLGNYTEEAMKVEAVSPSGKKIACPPVQFKTVGKTGFNASETGVYRISLDSGRCIFSVASTSHPMLINGQGRRIGFCKGAGKYYFWVPEGTEEFAIRVVAPGALEAVRARLLNPKGQVVEDVNNIVSAHQFDVKQSKDTPGRVWGLELIRADISALEDHEVDIMGIPPLLAGSKEGLLKHD